MESGAGFNLYSMAEAQHLCYGFNAPRQLEKQLPRSVGNNLHMVNDCSPLFDEQVTLFDVHEHNSGQFVWVLVEKTPVTTRNDMFFEHFLSLNIVYLSK